MIERLETQQISDSVCAAIIKLCSCGDTIKPSYNGTLLTGEMLYGIVNETFFTGDTKELFKYMRMLHKKNGCVPTYDFIRKSIRELCEEKDAERLISDLEVNIRTEIKFDGEELGRAIANYCRIAAMHGCLESARTEMELFLAMHNGKSGFFSVKDEDLNDLASAVEKKMKPVTNNPFTSISKFAFEDMDSFIMTGETNERFPSGNAYYDALMYGGWEKGNFIVNIAGTGTGKTTMFENLAVSSSKNGKNVCVVSLEQPLRIYARHINSILNNTDRKSMEATTVRIPSGYGKIYVLYAGYGAEYESVINYVKNKESELGLKFDVVMIDYIGALKEYSSFTGAGMYGAGKMIAQKMANDAKDNGWVIVTATQANRNQKENDIDLSCIAESAAISHTADLIVGIYRDTSTGETVLKCLKNRGGASGKNSTFRMGFDTFNGKYEPVSYEAVDGLTSTQNGIIRSYGEKALEEEKSLLDEKASNYEYEELKNILD